VGVGVGVRMTDCLSSSLFCLPSLRVEKEESVWWWCPGLGGRACRGMKWTSRRGIEGDGERLPSLAIQQQQR
jgi:hypothetical protein